MKPLTFDGTDHLRTATVDGTRWLDRLQLWQPTEQDQLVTGEVETAVVLLRGTFDLFGGPTAWPARGARQTPFTGRPMAVFLPPRTTFRAERGRGEILLVSARQPVAAPAADGRAGLGLKALLPLAGSGKSFDPNSGEWRPAETFPSAPESLPPRRMERIAVGPVTVERVLAPDYKAATLSIDEVVLSAGGSLRLAEVPGRPPSAEVLVFVRSEGTSQVIHAGLTTALAGDAAFWLPTPNGVIDLALAATGGRSYVLVAYAGKG